MKIKRISLVVLLVLLFGQAVGMAPAAVPTIAEIQPQLDAQNLGAQNREINLLQQQIGVRYQTRKTTVHMAAMGLATIVFVASASLATRNNSLFVSLPARLAAASGIAALMGGLTYSIMRATKFFGLYKNYGQIAQLKNDLRLREDRCNQLQQDLTRIEIRGLRDRLADAHNELQRLRRGQANIVAPVADAAPDVNPEELAPEIQPAVDDIIQECPICGEQRAARERVLLHCGHSKCRECLMAIVNTGLNGGSTATLRCPEPSCVNAVFTQEDVVAIAVLDANPLEILARYDQITFNEYLAALGPDARQCPTPDCHHVWIFEHVDGRPDAVPVTCPGCHHICCSDCRVEWNIHDGRTCAQAQAEQARLAAMGPEQRGDMGVCEYLQANGGFLCPNCGIANERNGGCDHVVCGRAADDRTAVVHGCGGEFCIQCMLPWAHHGINWHGAGCQGAFQEELQQGNLWAQELNRWIQEAHGRTLEQGREHWMQLVHDRGGFAQARAFITRRAQAVPPVLPGPNVPREPLGGGFWDRMNMDPGASFFPQ